MAMLPAPVVTTFREYCAAKFAVTKTAESITTVSGFARPLKPPLHPVNRFPLFGIAVKTTTEELS